MKGNIAYCCFEKKGIIYIQINKCYITILFHDKANYDVWIKCVGFHIC